MPDISDTALLAALQTPRLLRLAVWERALEEHRRHPSFRVQTWPYSREYGFTCECGEHEEEWRIDITRFKDMLPEVRARVLSFFQHHVRRSAKLNRKKSQAANYRARSLLHRHLTRQQRAELRHTRAFKILGRDGRTYEITEGTATNVFLEHEGTRYALCVVPKEEGLPLYDQLLAQKIMLETDPDAFLRLAKVVNTVTRQGYDSGGFLLGDEPRPWSRETIGEIRARLHLTPEQIEAPQEWVEERLREATTERIEVRDA